ETGGLAITDDDAAVRAQHRRRACVAGASAPESRRSRIRRGIWRNSSLPKPRLGPFRSLRGDRAAVGGSGLQAGLTLRRALPPGLTLSLAAAALFVRTWAASAL